MNTTTKTEPAMFREAAQRSMAPVVWRGITAMFVALACAALFYWHDLNAGPIFAGGLLFFASLTALAAWSARVSERPESAKMHKRTTRIFLVVLLAGLPLVTVWALLGWVAAGIGALFVLTLALMILSPVNVDLPSCEKRNGDGFFYGKDGMMLGADDSIWAGDGLLASPTLFDD